jgi:hypothetical protein
VVVPLISLLSLVACAKLANAELSAVERERLYLRPKNCARYCEEIPAHGNFLSEGRDRVGGKRHARFYRRHGASLMLSQLNIGGASSLYGAPSIAELSAETEQLPDFATHRPRKLWRML